MLDTAETTNWLDALDAVRVAILARDRRAFVDAAERFVLVFEPSRLRELEGALIEERDLSDQLAVAVGGVREYLTLAPRDAVTLN